MISSFIRLQVDSLSQATQAVQAQGASSPVQSNVQLPPTDAVRAAKQARLEELRRKAAGIQ